MPVPACFERRVGRSGGRSAERAGKQRQAGQGAAERQRLVCSRASALRRQAACAPRRWRWPARWRCPRRPQPTRRWRWLRRLRGGAGRGSRQVGAGRWGVPPAIIMMRGGPSRDKGLAPTPPYIEQRKWSRQWRRGVCAPPQHGRSPPTSTHWPGRRRSGRGTGGTRRRWRWRWRWRKQTTGLPGTARWPVAVGEPARDGRSWWGSQPAAKATYSHVPWPSASPTSGGGSRAVPRSTHIARLRRSPGRWRSRWRLAAGPGRWR